MITRRTFAFLMVMMLLAPASLLAATKEEIVERQAERLPELSKLKQQGVIGETSEGYLDFVETRTAKASKLFNEENADRRKLYTLIAEKEGTTPDKVAQINARRNFERAKKGDFLKEDAKWRKKS